MKRKLKITYGQLEATQERVAVFRNALENIGKPTMPEGETLRGLSSVGPS